MVDSGFAKQIRGNIFQGEQRFFVHHLTMDDLNILFAAQHLKILKGTEVDVRRVIPFVRQQIRYRHPPAGSEIVTRLPVPEIGEGNDALLTDPQHLVQHQMRIMQRLQCLRHQHGIKTFISKISQTAIQVLLNHVQTFIDTQVDLLRINLQAVTFHLLVVDQKFQQGAIAAPQVENPAALRDPVLYFIEIYTHNLLRRDAGEIAGKDLLIARVRQEESIVTEVGIDLRI